MVLKLNTGAPNGSTPSGGMKKIELPNATSGSGKTLIPPQQPSMSLVKPVGKKNAKGLPPWIWIAAGLGALVILAIVAFMVVSGNLGTNAPKKETPKSSIHDTSRLPIKMASTAFVS